MEDIIKIMKEKYTLKSSMESVKGIVIPRFFRLSLPNAINLFDSLPIEYRTSWTKLLMDIDMSKSVLKKIIKSLFGVYDGKIIELADLDMTSIPRKVTQIFANTKDRKQQRKLARLIQETLGNQYLVILVNSDETSNRDAEQDVKGLIKKTQKENKYVVILSKDMGSRSFSVPEIDTVVLMFDRGSYATVSQKISRVLTPGNTYDGEVKIFANIISLSLDPNRYGATPIDEYIIYEAEKVDVDELNDGIKRVLRSIQIFTNGPHGEMEIEKDEYTKNLLDSTSLIKLGAESSKVDNIIFDSVLVKQLLGVTVNKGEKEKLLAAEISTVISTDGGTTNTSKEKQTNTKIEDNRQKLKEILKNIVENVVEISEINNCESNDIIETLDMIDSKGYSEEVIFEVGVDSQTVKKVILMGGISRKLLNTIITSYNSEEVLLF
jgi:superfamily II DNA or RNA helicase